MTRKPVRVSQLNAYIARLISADGALSDIAVTGELSDYKLHGSGHVFFALKDERARIDCFLPYGIARTIRCELKDGMEITVQGYVNVYEKGGRYSLTIRELSVQEAQGDLAQAFEQLKQKLSEKGYFDPEGKKPLPAFPEVLAIVTSGTGAAIEDMLKILQTRNHVVDILIFPTLVQGMDAGAMIASRIRQANADFPEIDILIVGRGGGSSEDLNAFNTEIVADAIYESRIPVISAVGHETDFTIADFVADCRAETPSAAAVLAVPDTDALSGDIDALYTAISGRLHALVSAQKLRVRASNMETLLARLRGSFTERRLHARNAFCALEGAVKARQECMAARLERQDKLLHAVSPLSVLSRGYVILENSQGKALTHTRALVAEERVTARFVDGTAALEVKEVTHYGK